MGPLFHLWRARTADRLVRSQEYKLMISPTYNSNSQNYPLKRLENDQLLTGGFGKHDKLTDARWLQF